MTIKLYEQDAYCREFTATVLSCEETKKGYAVVLDQTAFFPEGGGQPADLGALGGATVLDVQVKNEIITHTVDKALAVGETVSGALDWNVRYARMQNHTGEHLLSGLIHAAHGYDNVGFHLNDTLVTLDVSGPLTAEELASLELNANRAVYENREIFATYPSPDEIGAIDYRSKLDLTEGVRLITIDGYDVCACCAPHVKRTGEIGLVKILEAIPYKGGTRISMLCGLPAFRDYVMLHEDNRANMRLLSAPRDKVAEFVARDHDTVTALRAEIKALSEQLAAAQLDVVQTVTATCGFTKDASFDALRTFAEQYSEDGKLCAMFSDAGDGTMSYFLFVPEGGDIRDTVKAMNAAFSGKGGGKPHYAQGKLTATKEQIVAFFEE